MSICQRQRSAKRFVMTNPHIHAKSWGFLKKPIIRCSYGIFYVKQYSEQSLNLSYVPVEGNNDKRVVFQTPLITADLWLLLRKSESAAHLFRNIPALQFCSSSRKNVKWGTNHCCDTWLTIAV